MRSKRVVIKILEWGVCRFFTKKGDHDEFGVEVWYWASL
jgi:hypothetical protein